MHSRRRPFVVFSMPLMSVNAMTLSFLSVLIDYPTRRWHCLSNSSEPQNIRLQAPPTSACHSARVFGKSIESRTRWFSVPIRIPTRPSISLPKIATMIPWFFTPHVRPSLPGNGYSCTRAHTSTESSFIVLPSPIRLGLPRSLGLGSLPVLYIVLLRFCDRHSRQFRQHHGTHLHSACIKLRSV